MLLNPIENYFYQLNFCALDGKWSKLLPFLINTNSVTKNIHVAMRYTKVVYLIFHNHVVPSELLPIKKKSLLSQQFFYSILIQYLGFLFLTFFLLAFVWLCISVTSLVAILFSCNDSQHCVSIAMHKCCINYLVMYLWSFVW